MLTLRPGREPDTTADSEAGAGKQGDRVWTPAWVVWDMLQHFRPALPILEPFRGQGAFTSRTAQWDWCEIDDGRDFFDWTTPVSWIVSNPPYSKLRPVWRHAATVADNILFLIPLRNFFSGYGFVREALAYGGMPEIRLYGTGNNVGFPMGNAIGAIHWKRGYSGPTVWTDASELRHAYDHLEVPRD